jgi:hypothetical protein
MMIDEKTIRKGIVAWLLVSELSILVMIYFAFQRVDWEAYLINIASDIVIVGGTLWYIDQVLASHREERWIPSKERIARRLKRFLDSIHFFLLFPITHDKYKDNTIEKMRDIVKAALSELDSKGAENLANVLERKIDESYRILDIFGRWLEPEWIEDILAIHDYLEVTIGPLKFPEQYPDIPAYPSMASAIKKAIDLEMKLPLPHLKITIP